jgi:arginyl-tRNA synthetase
MRYAIDRFYAEVRDAVAAAAGLPADEVRIETPKRTNVAADLAFPTFQLAAALGVAPHQLAFEIASVAEEQLAEGSSIASVDAHGPFVNFTLDPSWLMRSVLSEVAELGECYGHDDQSTGKVVVVDYSSPNAAKRMHIGHVRTTIIGQALVNVFRALGFTVIGDNHIGDWGKGFGILLTAIEHEGMPQGDGEALLAEFERLYAQYSALAAADEAVSERARAWSLRLEQGEPGARAIWQTAVDLTLSANQRSYERLGVRFDHVLGESFYVPMLPEMIVLVAESDVAQRSESGALVVELGDELPTFLFQRSDGGTLYHTRDLATLDYRLREFAPDRIVYVVGVTQELYLRQLFALARALDLAEGVDLVHVPFGTVFDAGGQALSTRRGNMVYLESLLDEAHDRASEVIDRTRPELPAAERETIAEAVGVGAVIYNDLHQSPGRDITLDWDRMLALDGDSAPYIQYMHARCRSILRRAEADEVELIAADIAFEELRHPSEIELVKQIARLPPTLREAGERYSPQVIAAWCYATARAVAAFYRDCRVLEAETPALRLARLRLVAASALSLRNGLTVLGIAAPQRL